MLGGKSVNKATAVVLAAGKGTRMQSDLPKVLCEANGKPLIEYVLDSLRAAGVEKMIAVVGYKEELVRDRLSNFDDVEFATQAEQLGTGHAVMMCREQLEAVDGPLVVVAGDSPMLQSSSIQSLIQEYNQSRPACVLGTLIHDDPEGLGRIVRDASGGFVGIVEEKDATEEQKLIREVNMSTYLFDCQKMLAELDKLTSDNKQNEYYVTDLPALLLSRGEDVRALPVLDPVEALSVNTVAHLEQVENEMKRKDV